MPIYIYKCLKCNNIQEVWQKWSDKPPICVNCGKSMKKLPSSFSAHGYMAQGREKAMKTFDD
jgi:putative FmdB family regulatory protein